MSRDLIVDGGSTLGIELGSSRIKACLIGAGGATLATGSHDWENQYVDGTWTYSLEAVWAGVQGCYASLVADVDQTFGCIPTSFRAIGVSAMMHGYLAFDDRGELLVPFRTWRNTSTGPAAEALSQLFGGAIPLRWSVAHYFQAILDEEPHVASVASLTTLAGYVHRALTGCNVLGVGDAAGMFPIDPAVRDYDARLLRLFDERAGAVRPGARLGPLLPTVLCAGEEAGRLTDEGAALLDPTGTLRPGIAMCPPEGDAGTGMVATNTVAPRTANMSVGTSIFAMVVLDEPLNPVPAGLDLVATPVGDPVVMVHCNNGASELDAWTGILVQFATAAGWPANRDDVFQVALQEALEGAPDAAGLMAYNYLAGEPITGMVEGRPLFVRAPDAQFTFANFMRAQVYSAFATLSLGMRVLAAEGVHVDVMVAHGGLFRTKGVAQRLLAAAIDTPVAVGSAPGEGGAWGIALLAGYLAHAAECDLGTYLERAVFSGADVSVVAPDPDDVAGYGRFLDRYRAGLTIERTAAEAL